MTTVKPSSEEITIFARTLWAEARGEGIPGMIAVGWTIRNRVDLDLHNDGKPDWWGEGYAGVCKKPWQFSCWNKGDPNQPYMVGEKEIPAKQFTDAMAAALTVLKGDRDPTMGATHYYSTTMKKAPVWANPKLSRKTVQIGKHIFFTDVK